MATKKLDFRKLVDMKKAETKKKEARARLDGFIDSLIPDITAAYDWYRTAATDYMEKKTKFNKLGPARRQRTYEDYEFLHNLAYGFLVRDSHEYSGETTHLVTFEERAIATTATSAGERYSNTCSYNKTDATHHFAYNLNNVYVLLENSNLIKQSMRDGLFILDLENCGDGFKAKWAKRKNTRWDLESGFIAVCGNFIYHSTKSIDKAVAGAKRKFEREKNENRTAIHHRLKTAEDITLADIRRATGWCLPGCRQWMEKNGIGGKRKIKREKLVEIAEQENDYYSKKLVELIS